ncbi:MAG: hypothetical protein ABSG55_04535 [Dehalococcoidia bacterium]
MAMGDRLRGLARSRLMRLRGRIDRRIERLDEKRQRLDARIEKHTPQAAEEAPAEEPKQE